MKKRLIQVRQLAYTLFSFCYFLYFALEMTIIGFFLITILGASEKHKKMYHRILQRKSKFVINHVPGTSFSMYNQNNEQFEKPSVIICNHQSHLDLMAIMMLSPNLIILTKKWVWRNPFYGIVIRYADFLPICQTEDMVQKMSNMVNKGYSIMVFPEGTRSEDSHIRRFHKGAFYIAEKLNLDIVPVYLDGFGKVLPKKSFLLHSGHMKVEIMPRIHRNELLNNCGCRELAKKMHKIYVKKKHEEMRDNR